MTREPHEYVPYPKGHFFKESCVKCGHGRLDLTVHPSEVHPEVVQAVVASQEEASSEPLAIRRMREALKMDEEGL